MYAPYFQIGIQIGSEVVGDKLSFLDDVLEGVNADEVSKAGLGYFAHALSCLRLLDAKFIGKFKRINNPIKHNRLNFELNIILREDYLTKL